MAVKRIGQIPQLANEKVINTVILEKLHKIGQEGVKFAIENHQFNNRTNNLEDSYGYAIYNNGTMVEEPFLFNPVATQKANFQGKDYSGHEEALKFLRGFKPSSNGWVLVVVAGMPYADFVQEYFGLDVLQGSFMAAKAIADTELKNMRIYGTN